MLIVDSQVHVWAASSAARPWPPGARPQRAQPLGPEQLLAEMRAAGVERAVLVPPLWEGHRNDFALAAAAAWPGRFAVMGLLEPGAGQARDRIRGWRNQAGMLGLRFALHRPELWGPFVDGSMEWIWQAAEQAQVPVSVLVPHPLVPLLDDVARRHPQLKITLDHLGLAGPAKDDEAFAGLDAVLRLAGNANVSAKVSALPCHTSQAYPFPALQRHVRRALEAFGPRRLFWGTDLSRSPIPYRQHVTLFLEEMSWIGAEDLDWIMGRGLCAWLGWPLPAAGGSAATGNG